MTKTPFGGLRNVSQERDGRTPTLTAYSQSHLVGGISVYLVNKEHGGGTYWS